VRDLTETLEREREIARKAAEFEAIFNSIRDVAVFMDLGRHIITVNTAGLNLTGFTLNEIRGLNTRHFYVNPEDHQILGEYFFTLDGPRTKKPYRTSLLKKDGSHLPVEIIGGPVRLNNGEVIGYLGIARDLSERITMEQQLLYAQKLESLGVLAGGIAHDFNNIMMSVMGNADLALSSLPADSPAYRNLKAITSAAKKASDLCKQMLSYSGRGKFQLQKTDINKVITETIEILQLSITKKAELLLNLSPKAPIVDADPSQMQQVVMNLIINASEAIDKDRGVIIVSTVLRDCDNTYLKTFISTAPLSPGHYCIVRVSDSGCGMSQSVREKIFDPFFTTKFQGRGLGMASVLGIIQGHKGGIKIESKPDDGTDIEVLLPVSVNRQVRVPRAKVK